MSLAFDTRSGLGGAPGSPRHLLISHNLDGLVEHEWRRRQTTGQMLREMSQSPDSDAGLTSLPPPPRHAAARKEPWNLKRAASALEGEIPPPVPPKDHEEEENPFINPAPTLEEIFQLAEQPAAKSDRAFSKSKMPDSGRRWRERQASLPMLYGNFGHTKLPSTISLNGLLDPWMVSSETIEGTSANTAGAPRWPFVSHDHKSLGSSNESNISVLTNGPISSDDDDDAPHITNSGPQIESDIIDTSPFFFDDNEHDDHDSDDSMDTQLRTFDAYMGSFKSGLPNLLSRHPSPKVKSSVDMTTATPPPTTNFLDLEERSDLVRKSRKLARLFGETPGADAMAHQETSRALAAQGIGARASSTSALHSARRHSMPMSPDDSSFLSFNSSSLDDQQSLFTANFSFETGSKRTRRTSSIDPSIDPSKPNASESAPAPAPTRGGRQLTSFIDLSEDEDEDQPMETRLTRSSSISDSISSSSLAAEKDKERRRKRERLAKIHRFLGPHVPSNLVLGIDDPDVSLAAIHHLPGRDASSDSDDLRLWSTRRRSTPAVLEPLEDFERRRDDLDEHEKALNVRRAHKMEKVFGVAPPQTLYHTRHTPSSSLVNVSTYSVLSPTKSSDAFSSGVGPSKHHSSRVRARKPSRQPSIAESSLDLIDKSQEFDSYGFDDRHAGIPTPNATTYEQRHSNIYNHYQQSLNSLNDMMDRDDKESIQEFHQFLSSGLLASCGKGLDEGDDQDDFSWRERRSSRASSSLKSERRRSLPTRTSMLSLASETSVSIAPSPDFQTRRRRAAKLTQFFGVNHRELITDVIDSLENGVEQEHRRGTLQPEELEDLLDRLRHLKLKRSTYVF